VIVAHQMMGGPVSSEHGGPVRLYVAPMYGYKSLKWLERIEVVDRLVPGYWEERGYDIDAWVGQSNGRDDDPVEA
jgi:DMSO/TMAO reductase YedYZ molybdopterin-dependent catalytic subunit